MCEGDGIHFKNHSRVPLLGCAARFLRETSSQREREVRYPRPADPEEISELLREDAMRRRMRGRREPTETRGEE